MMLLAVTAATWCPAQEFFRNLPDPKFSAQLTQQAFPSVDGVIIFKEQSLKVHQAEVTYRGYDLVGLGMTHSTVLIAKVLNEAAVKRFGSFEYEYPERYGDEIRSGFMARARVQKPDGTVIVMPESDVSIVVSYRDNDGDPLARKALFKIPDLMVGDVVQLEYVLTEPFVRAYSGIFYYQDRMPVLFSNVAITCQARDNVRVFSFPPERVGEPTIAQIAKDLGAGETRYWSVKNLNAIPNEPHGPAFGDLSVMTAFVTDPAFHEQTTWDLLAKNYWNDYLDRGSVKSSRVEALGFGDPKGSVTREITDSLYTALRKAITLKPFNDVYPLVDLLDDVFKKKSGDASDLAAIFYKILTDWKVKCSGVWIRDKREGTVELTVPTLRWFDRIGVLVNVGGTEVLYDFDRAIPARFSPPWFLKGITVMVIDKKGARTMTIPQSKQGEAWIRESHSLTFDDRLSAHDSIVTSGSGSPIEEWRENCYTLKGTELTSYLQHVVADKCIAGAGDIRFSPIMDDREVRVTVVGGSTATATAIDKYVTVRPTNQIFQAYYEEMFRPTRTNPVVLDEPTLMTLEETIHHPSGYVLASVPNDTIMRGFPGGIGTLSYTKTGDDVTMTASVDLKSEIIDPRDYSSMMQLIIALQHGSEQGVTFRKK
jgi:hypothetical protein